MSQGSDGRTEASIYSCAAPALLLASQLAMMRLPSAEELRQRLVGVLDRFVSTARSAGVDDADIAEARYALVAFMDEQILKSEWSGRSEWMNQPLQLLLYREYTAGENFYVRMRSLLAASGRTAALEAYYLCLSLGFRGASSALGEAGSPAQFTETAKDRLRREFEPPAQLAPHARPRDRADKQRQLTWPLIAWLIGCVVVAAGLWGGLGWSMSRSAAAAVERVPAAVAPR